MTASFFHDLEAAFGWTLTASWQAAVLAVIVLLVQKLAGSRLNARWHHALWLLVLIRLVLPALPQSSLSLLQFAPPPPMLAAVVERPLLVPDAPSSFHLPGVRPEGTVQAQPVSIYSMLAVAWLIGAAALLILTWLINHRFARQVAQARAVSDPELLRLFDEAKTEFGIRRSIRLVESERVQSPAIMGLFQPALLLPADARERFDEAELRLIFLHEVAHLKRGDLFIQALIALLQIVHWFNPVLWFAFRRMRVDREPATDALVLSHVGEADKQRYGLMLVKLLEHFEERHSLPALIGLLEEKDQFKQRVLLIARFARGGYGWSVGAVLLISFLAVAFLTQAKAQTPAPTNTNSVPASTSTSTSTTTTTTAAAAPAKPSPPPANDDTPLPTDNPQVVDLYHACDRGDLDTVKKLVAAGVPVDGTVGGLRSTPLIQAVYSKHLDVVRFLLDSHANVNLVDSEGSTPLLHACLGGNLEIVKMLIAGGVDVNLGSHYGRTPLMHAVKNGNEDVVQALLDAHVKLDGNCDQGPAILWAAGNGRLHIVKMLGDAGANVNLNPDHGSPVCYSTLGNAAALGDLAMIDYLIDKNADLNGAGGAGGLTPLFAALEYNKADALQRLLEAGADPNRKNGKGQTPLMDAAAYAYPDCVQLLINHRADVDTTDPGGETALTIAGDIGESEIVDMLKQAGAKQTEVHIISKGPPDPKLTPAQQWALAVAMFYTQRAGNQAGVLGGNADAGGRQQRMQKDWGITDKASLLTTLDDLRTTGMRAEFLKDGPKLAAMTDEEFAHDLARQKPEEEAAYTAMRKSYLRWKEKSGLAWDMCRAAILVSDGYAAHYIDEQEAWGQLMKIAEQTQENFSSWQEMSDNFLDGREIWNNGRDPHFELIAQLLLTDPNSPWTKLKWQTPLGNG